MQITIPAAIKSDFERWLNFLEHEVHFALKDSNDHTKDHCARVLHFALRIADQMGLAKEEREALALAACFHDSRRQDDWLDVGHGLRAADYYREYCYDHKRDFDVRVYLVIAFHDHDDALGEAALKGHSQGVLLYHIFKDADALDRFRLGPFDLDINYLRTDAARALYDYARVLWADTWPIKF